MTKTSFIEVETKEIHLWSGLSIALEKIGIPSSYLQRFVQSTLFPFPSCGIHNECSLREPRLRNPWANPGHFACRIWNLINFRLWNLESWSLESGIQLKESGIPLTIGIRNPSSTEKEPGSSTWNLESTAWNPECTTVDVLDSLLIHRAIWEETVPGVNLFYLFLFLQVYYCYTVWKQQLHL